MMLPKDIEKSLFDYIYIEYNGDNEEEVMYNLILCLQDILFDVKEQILEENGFYDSI